MNITIKPTKLSSTGAKDKFRADINLRGVEISKGMEIGDAEIHIGKGLDRCFDSELDAIAAAVGFLVNFLGIPPGKIEGMEPLGDATKNEPIEN